MATSTIPIKSIKLLWTNPSPTSTFSGQKVPLNLSGYDAIGVAARPYISSAYDYIAPMTVVSRGDAQGLLMTFAGAAANFSGAFDCGVRGFNWDDTGVTFYGTSEVNMANSVLWTTGNNGHTIPVHIWGIKY